MSKFFSKPVISNILRFCFNFIKLKTFEKSSFNFVKHKLIFLTAPLLLLTGLMSLFIFNICTDKYDVDGIFENSKTVINLPVNDEVDSYTLNKLQQITTNILNYSSNAQAAKRYNNFAAAILNKASKNEVKITTNKFLNITQQQKELLFNEFKMNFPNLIKLKAADEIKAYSWHDSQKSLEFWLQFAFAASILIVLLLIYLGIKFKKLGFWSTIIVASANLLFSIGSAFLVLVILTKKVNLTFITAMSFYFTTNLTILFTEIKKQLPDTKINRTKALEIANKSIQKTVPLTAFIVATLFVALACSIMFCLIFDNYILFYFAISTVISIILDLLFNLFCNAQLWALLKRKSIKTKETALKEA